VNGTNIIRDFAYGDGGVWPASADGEGPSLLLRDPFSNPDHAVATDWIPSAIPGGLPSGSATPLTFEAWRELFWPPGALTNLLISGLGADPDGDGFPNFAEYALGLHPNRPQATKRPYAAIETIGQGRYLTLQYNVSTAATEATVTFEVSSNLVDWLTGPPNTELLWSAPNFDGTTTIKFRDLSPADTTPYHFLRLHVGRLP